MGRAGACLHLLGTHLWWQAGSQVSDIRHGRDQRLRQGRAARRRGITRSLMHQLYYFVCRARYPEATCMHILVVSSHTILQIS